jgi:L-rhamnose mutarotase
MMEVVLHSVLKDGQERNYETAHAEVPEDLLASLVRSGIRDWTIWRSGRHLFHLVECEDFAAAMSQLEVDPVNERWQKFIAQFVDHFEANGDGHEAMTLPRVWSLRAQAGSTVHDSLGGRDA